MRTGDLAFLAFTASWIAYDAIATEDEMLTSAFRRFNTAHPAVAATILAITAAHLADRFQPLGIGHLDPFTATATVLRQAIRRYAC